MRSTLFAILAASLLVVTAAITLPILSAEAAQSRDTVHLEWGARVRDVPLTVAIVNPTHDVLRGATGEMSFRVTNRSDRDIEVVAAMKVIPGAAEAHLLRLQCFCYEKQVIPARSSQFFPVRFYVDDAFDGDRMQVNFTFFSTAGFHRQGGQLKS